MNKQIMKELEKIILDKSIHQSSCSGWGDDGLFKWEDCDCIARGLCNEVKQATSQAVEAERSRIVEMIGEEVDFLSTGLAEKIKSLKGEQ